MKVTVISGRELTPDLAAIWSRIQERNPSLRSPYFRPEFTQAVADVRADVYVGVIDEGNQTIGFFPFQRRRVKQGVPVGGPMSDYHGVIIDENVTFSPEYLLRQCGLWTWTFDHLIAAQAHFLPGAWLGSESPCISLTGNWDAYRLERESAGSRVVEQTERKQRKFEREVGSLHFVVDVKDCAVLHQVITWKSQQYQRTGLVDLFGFAWARQLLERLLEIQTDDFAGLLSALFSNDRVVAAHMGMRSDKVWHWWFPTYDHEFGDYSPGAILLHRMIQSVSGMGIAEIDLGKGDDGYKRRFANATVPLAEGSVIVNPIVRIARTFGERAWQMARNSPLHILGRVPARAIRRIRRWHALR